jgi:ABC-type branched-subunit amino acid transport system substrate-binding protein
VAVGLLAGSMLTALVTAGGGATVPTKAGVVAASPAAVGSADGAGAITGSTVTGGPGADPRSASSAPDGGTASGQSGAAAPPGPAPAAASVCAGSPATGVGGVTNEKVKIGVGIPDIAIFYPVLGPSANIGDQQAHFRAHLDAMRKRGQLPVCGRDIEPVFRTYNILDPAQSRAVCQGFVNDDKVFAVLTQFAFRDANCVTQENKTVLIDDGVGSTLANFDAAGGRFFTVHSPPIEVQYQAYATWVATTLAATHKVGVYYSTSTPELEQQAKKYIVDVLKRHGVDPVIATTSNADPTVAVTGGADPNDAVAVQRFRAEGVTLVMRSMSTGFFEEARRQGYRPLFVMSGTEVNDATSGPYNPEYMDGSLGIYFDNVGKLGAGEPLDPRADECLRDLEAAGIKRPENPEWAEATASMLGCDLLDSLVWGLRAAGRNLTSDRLALGIQTADLPASLVPALRFSPTKHFGTVQNRQGRYHKDCACWLQDGSWRPLYV